MKKLLIIGAGGHGKVVADIALKMNQWEEISFLDDNVTLEWILGYKVLDTTSNWKTYIDSHDLFVAIGSNSLRMKFIKQIEQEQGNLAILIHPSAIIGSMIDIKHGTVIMAGVVINCSTRIGKGCIINTGATIDHDCIIGDYVHVSPGVNLAGNVCIGECSWLGIGSSVINNIEITKDCLVGAGAVVVHSLKESGTHVGIPARRSK